MSFLCTPSSAHGILNLGWSHCLSYNVLSPIVVFCPDPWFPHSNGWLQTKIKILSCSGISFWKLVPIFSMPWFRWWMKRRGVTPAQTVSSDLASTFWARLVRRPTRSHLVFLWLIIIFTPPRNSYSTCRTTARCCWKRPWRTRRWSMCCRRCLGLAAHPQTGSLKCTRTCAICWGLKIWTWYSPYSVR